ncbi:MAG: N-acetylmuramoyl-L-alanine amidase [Catenulispora sp.]|nr:N-acetylmuramoyl-L-alanine amidase [Catenulispora sp.]
MKLVSRAQWGAKPSRYDLVYIGSTRGVKIHYEGTPVPASLADPDQHSQCDDRMRAIQASHLANRKEDYSDIAYNFVVCPHGYVYEGRGLHRKTAANGNQPLNIAHYAVCAMVGSEGLTKPTDPQLNGLRDAIEYLRSDGGAGTEIKGHRDGYATECPGGPLYAWVQKGAPRPAGTVTEPTKPRYEPFPGAAFFKAGHRSPVIAAMHKRLVSEGCGRYQSDANADTWGSGDVRSYAAWQRHLGYVGDGADGIPGKTSWDKLHVPNV